MAEYLEREELLRQLHLWHIHRNDELPDHFHYTGIKAWLEAMPAEDVQPVKHGKWVQTTQPMGWTDEECAECSVCGEDFVLDEMGMDDVTDIMNYCPNCGAKMDGEA